MGIKPKDPSRLNCIQLSQLTGKPLWAVRTLKRYAKGIKDDPFGGGTLTTLEKFLRWCEFHTEFVPSAVRNCRKPAARRQSKREKNTLRMAQGRKPLI